MYKQSTTGSIVLSPEHFSLGAGEFLGVTSNTNLALSAPALLEALDSARAFIFRHAQSDCNTGELICKKTEAELIKIDAAIAAARGTV